jgi:hypothetical protein
MFGTISIFEKRNMVMIFSVIETVLNFKSENHENNNRIH